MLIVVVSKWLMSIQFKKAAFFLRFDYYGNKAYLIIYSSHNVTFK
jgi:hypothetical protein